MEPLNDAVGTGMVCRGAAVFSAKQAAEGSEQGAFKLPASIRGNNAGAAETANPCRNEGFCDRFCRDVRNWYGFGPTGEAVNHCENVPAVTGGRKWSDQIKMDVVKATARWQKRLRWGLRVAGHLGCLTSEARTGPLADISVDARPDVPLCDEALRGSDAGVADVVERVKHSTTKGSRNEGSRRRR